MLAIFLRNLTNICQEFKKNIFIQKKERYLLPLIFTSLLLFDENILYNPIAFMLIIFFCCIILLGFCMVLGKVVKVLMFVYVWLL